MKKLLILILLLLASTLRAEPAAKSLEQSIEESIGAQFTGTVLVAKNGTPLFFKSYGLANRETNTPNTNETQYNLASVDKAFTQMALYKLRDEGKLKLDATLRSVLPDYPSPAAAEQITIQQLIEHRAGLPNLFNAEFIASDKTALRNVRDYLQFFATEPLDYEPGTKQQYSNSAYIVLGLVIEKLSGMPYHEYVRKHVFAPLGMRNTTPEACAKCAVATGYRRDGSANTAVIPPRGSSAGGGWSTAGDLLRFAEALRKTKGSGAIAGGFPGIANMIYFEDDFTFVILGNYDPPMTQRVAERLMKLLGMTGELNRLNIIG
ncbi:MAG TPA: serine hydrolase domain-containing protein [Thermoanaerobaculia bacterium]